MIGNGGRHISRERALEHVAGYSIFNDVSVRDYQFKSPQWTVGKNFDGTGPFGPVFVTADELPPGAKGLRIQTRLNGEVMQDANTDDMVFDVATLIVTISEAITLESGDIIVTGTPVRRRSIAQAACVHEGRRQGRSRDREDRRAVQSDRRRIGRETMTAIHGSHQSEPVARASSACIRSIISISSFPISRSRKTSTPNSGSISKRAATRLRCARSARHRCGERSARDPARSWATSAFGAFEDDVDRFAERLKMLGIARIAPPPGVDFNGLWFLNHDGVPIEIKAAPKTSPNEKSVFGQPSGGPGRVALRRTRPSSGPVRAALAHVLTFTRDVAKGVEFYTKVLGLRLRTAQAPTSLSCTAFMAAIIT